MSLLAVATSGRGVVDPAEPLIHADNGALLRGRAAFETMRVYSRTPFRYDAHLQRLSESAKRIGLPDVDKAEIQKLVTETLNSVTHENVVLRVYWTPGRERELNPQALVLVSELPNDLDLTRENGIKLISLSLGISTAERLSSPWMLAGVKSTSYAVNMAAEAEAQRRGANDAIFLDSSSQVLECPVSNVWWLYKDTLETPSLDLGILAGVTRAEVLRLAQKLNLKVTEGSWNINRLYNADEVFTSSSIRELMPAVSVDGNTIGNGTPGSLVPKLQEELRRAATPSPIR